MSNIQFHKFELRDKEEKLLDLKSHLGLGLAWLFLTLLMSKQKKVHPSREAGKWGEDSWGNPDPETKDLVDQDTLVMTIQSISNSCVAMFSFQHMPLYLILAVTLL